MAVGKSSLMRAANANSKTAEQPEKKETVKKPVTRKAPVKKTAADKKKKFIAVKDQMPVHLL